MEEALLRTQHGAAVGICCHYLPTGLPRGQVTDKSVSHGRA